MSENRAFVYIFDFIVSGILGVALMVSVEYVYAKLYPTKWIFEYQKLETVKPTFAVGEKIRLKSTSASHRVEDFIWNDTLHCDFGEGDVYFSSQTTRSDNFLPKKGLNNLQPTEWVYNAEIPDMQATCYVASVVTAELDFGIKKETSIESNDFEIR